MSKITELVLNSDHLSFSYEVTSSLSVEEIKNIYIQPKFLSVTWHAQEQYLKSFDTSFGPLKLAVKFKNEGYNVLLHLSCSFMKKKYLNDLLRFLEEKGICNLFIIRGETYDATTTDFETSGELITYIKKLTGNYFCIGVAGFPGDDGKLQLLKEKVECGVDFILTQACFEPILYNNFIHQCKAIGINALILPGIFPFETEIELKSFINLCKVKISENVLEHAKNNSGIALIAKLIFDIKKSSDVRHFHLFTINKIDIASQITKYVIDGVSKGED